jgi:Family of unknown function (DUF6497)
MGKMTPVLRVLTCVSLAAAPGLVCAAGVDDPIPVPSGQIVTYVEAISDAAGPSGLTLRFRFLAPAIARGGGTVTPEAAQDDMLALCRTYALPRIASTGPQPQQIVISLSDRPVEFGITDEEATQFFDAFGIEDGDCILELF